jgi:hypothetical protein
MRIAKESVYLMFGWFWRSVLKVLMQALHAAKIDLEKAAARTIQIRKSALTIAKGKASEECDQQ